jgi:hypothetical protein
LFVSFNERESKMPCRTDGMDEYERRKENPDYLRYEEERKRERERKWEEYKKNHDPPEDISSLTPAYLLCEAMTLLEEHDLLHTVSLEHLAWYRQHEATERERVVREAQEAIGKRPLTKRELRLIKD